MNHYLLIYELADDYLARRGEFRGAHLKLAGGALGEPTDRAILMFKGASPNGLIKSWTVRPWMTVVGDTAAHPVRP